jgi:hypothetical protein
MQITIKVTFYFDNLRTGKLGADCDVSEISSQENSLSNFFFYSQSFLFTAGPGYALKAMAAWTR